MYLKDTIAAISTAPGQSGIGIIRISGPNSLQVITKIFKASKQNNQFLGAESFKMVYGHIFFSGEPIDEVLVSFMRGPGSYTAEDVIEINCHGGTVVLGKILDIVLSNGARLAEPGEFTKRAFLNGRIDLSQAEAVMDIIKAKTEASLSVALKQLEGYFSNDIRELRQNIINIIAQIEAAVDFGDEDIEFLPKKALVNSIKEAVVLIDKFLKTSSGGKILRDGVSTAIIGYPNVGKSSLLNLLLKEERAIVTSTPGTTRDVIEEVINIKGIPLVLKDTAGIRDTKDEAEAIGVKRSQRAMADADLVLFVIDSSRPLTKLDKNLAGQLSKKKAIVILNKSDLVKKIKPADFSSMFNGQSFVTMSATCGQGLKELEDAIYKKVLNSGVDNDNNLLVSNVRHIRALKQAKESFLESIALLKEDAQEEVISVVLRDGADALGQIIGETTTEDILTEIFSSFCIGK